MVKNKNNMNLKSNSLEQLMIVVTSGVGLHLSKIKEILMVSINFYDCKPLRTTYENKYSIIIIGLPPRKIRK